MRYVCAALLLFFPTVAAAQKNQPPPPTSSITLSIPGLNCATPAGQATFRVSSWSWGASNPTPIGGGPGTPQLQDLHFVKAFDACSPALLSLVTSATLHKVATLTQQGADGVVTATVTLYNLRASSWQASSITTQETPTEQASLTFARVCIDTAAGAEFCYDSTAPTP